MGFRAGAWMKVWEVTPINAAVTKIKGTVSKKNKDTGTYETEFGEYCSCLGNTIAQRAASLKEGQTIKLKDIDVTTYYDKEKQQKYTNYKIFDFDIDDNPRVSNSNNSPVNAAPDPINLAYEGVSDDLSEEGLPF